MYRWLRERFRDAAAMAESLWEKEFIEQVFQLVLMGKIDRAILEVELALEQIDTLIEPGNDAERLSIRRRRRMRVVNTGFEYAATGESLKAILGALYFFMEFSPEDYFQDEDWDLE